MLTYEKLFRLNDAMRSHSTWCLGYIKFSVIIKFPSLGELGHTTHSSKIATLSQSAKPSG